jgi:hypothetical protein
MFTIVFDFSSMIIEIWEVAGEGTGGFSSPIMKKSKSESNLRDNCNQISDNVNYRKLEGMISFLYEGISTIPCREGVTDALYQTDYEKMHVIPTFKVHICSNNS